MPSSRNVMLGFYTALSLVVIFCSTIDFTLQNTGFTIAMLALIAAYIARSKYPANDSFEENHTTYLIRTIWIYSTIAAIGIIGLALVLVMKGNMDTFNAMANNMVNNGVAPSEEQMKAYVDQYVADNMDLIRQQYLIWLFPGQLYLVWRIYYGGSRAFKGYRVASPKKWL